MARPTNITLCSFCGKSHSEVKKLIAGPGVYICDNCIVLCKNVLDKEAEAANKKWAETHGGVPINHMVIVRDKIAKERPDVVEEIFRVFKAARDLDTTAPKGALDPYRFGVEANREALERVIDYSLKQQMITKKVTVDDLFDDFTRKLGA